MVDALSILLEKLKLFPHISKEGEAIYTFKSSKRFVSLLLFTLGLNFSTICLLDANMIFARDNKNESLIIINHQEKCIEIPANFHPRQFNRAAGLKNHHFITWEKGRAANKALFTTPVSDSVIHDALVTIGAVPGDNLSNETWSQRKDPKSHFPDMLIEGTVVKISFIRESKVFFTEDFIIDRQNKNFDFRFGGNRALIPIWKSGCVVCLQSCPGAKIGNHAYSIRDLENGNSVFDIVKKQAFNEGDSFTVRIALVTEKQ